MHAVVDQLRIKAQLLVVVIPLVESLLLIMILPKIKVQRSMGNRLLVVAILLVKVRYQIRILSRMKFLLSVLNLPLEEVLHLVVATVFLEPMEAV